MKKYWIEYYKSCGCSSEAPRKKDLIGYCGKHGGSYSERYCVPAESMPNKACSRRVPRRGAKVVKSKSKVAVGRTRG